MHKNDEALNLSVGSVETLKGKFIKEKENKLPW